MDERNNSIDNLNNTTKNNQQIYPSLTSMNSQVIEINRHQDILYYLRQIADNTNNRRRKKEDCDVVSQ